MFAGAIFNSHYPDPINPDKLPPDAPPYDLYKPTCTTDDISKCGDPRDVSNPGNPANPTYQSALAAWLRDPGKVKPMANTPEENPYANGLHGTNELKVRGMPNLGLTEEQITQLIAYLETLN
jgi:hypothetical protein